MPAVDPDTLPHFAFCDPASGKQELKRTRARSAVVVAALADPYMLFIRYAHATRQPPDKLVQEILDVNARFHPRAFGIEANGMQSVLGIFVQRDAQIAGQRIPLRSINQPTSMDKQWRIRNDVQPLWKDGRILLAAGLFDLKNELTAFPMGNTVDLVDALASIIRHLIPPRRVNVKEVNERAEVLRYLRARGYSEAAIAERMKHMSGDPRESARLSKLSGRPRPLQAQYGEVVVG